MTRRRRPPAARTGGALVAALALLAPLAGCSHDATPPAQNQASSATPTGNAPLLVDAVEPPRQLLPADIADEYGRRIASLLFRGLLRYDAKGRLVNEVAEDVSQEGPLLYRVKVRKGWVFGDGEPVTAASFVDAWDFAATPACGMLHADAFAGIAGYATLRGLPEPTPPVTTPTAPASGSGSTTSAPARTSAAAAPTTAPTTSGGATGGTPSPATTAAAPAAGSTACGGSGPRALAGLTIVNDLEFTVRLAVPDANFPDLLATLPYSPLPRAAFADPASFAQAPVGNGPYQLAGGWYPGKEVRLIPNASYSGGDPADNGGLTFRFFPDPAMTYPALLDGRLDVLDDVPLPALGRYKADLGFRAANQPMGADTSLVFPMNRPEWATPDGLAERRAISRAIDRQSLADGLFAGTRAPATDLSAPGIDGYSPGLCGDICRYDAQAAAKLMPAKPPVTSLEIAYNPLAGGRPAVEAICTAITSALKISCEAHAVPTDPTTGLTLDGLAARHLLTMPMLAEHLMSRPDLGGFLTPRFVAGSADNPSAYAGPAAQALLAKAAATTGADARRSAYQNAEQAILADLPEIPLWYDNATTSAGLSLQQVKIDVVGVPIYTELSRS